MTTKKKGWISLFLEIKWSLEIKKYTSSVGQGQRLDKFNHLHKEIIEKQGGGLHKG